MPHFDYSDEVHPERSRTVRAVYVALGLVFTAFGIAGVILPLVPGTPLLLVALFFFARASARLYNWLLNNRIVGPVLRSYRKHRKMPRRVKPRAMLAVALAFGFSTWLALDGLWLRIAWVMFGAGVLIYISRLPTHDEREAVTPSA